MSSKSNNKRSGAAPKAPRKNPNTANGARKTKPSKIRTKALAKKNVTKQLAERIARLSRVELHDLKQAEVERLRKGNTKIKKTRIQNLLNNVEIRTPFRPSKITSLVDIKTVHMFIRATLENISIKRSTVFLVNQATTPSSMRFYLFALLFAYLKQPGVGKVTGIYANSIPNVNPGWKVPKGFAKWMQYFAPASKDGCQQVKGLNFSFMFKAVSNAVGPGDTFQYAADGTSYVEWDYTGEQQGFILPMTSVATDPTDPTVPGGQTCFAYTPITPVTLAEWMQQAGNMDAVSNVIDEGGVPCFDFSWLPGIDKKTPYAPDSSAHSVTNQVASFTSGSPTSIIPGTCWLNAHDHYCPHASFLFSLNSVVQAAPGYSAKPVPNPIYDYNSKYAGVMDNPIPWYVQPMYTLLWLVDNADFVHRGEILHLQVKKHQLCTLFPNPRPVSGPSLQTLVTHAYQEILATAEQATKTTSNLYDPIGGSVVSVSQGGRANDDTIASNYFIFAFAVTQAVQRRYNETCVVPYFGPVSQLAGDQTIIFPQLMWVDSPALATPFPKTISNWIENMGPVLYNGQLFVPLSLEMNPAAAIPYPMTSPTGLGPVAVSGFGPDPEQLVTYPYENLLTQVVFDNSAWGATPIVVPYNITLDQLILNSAYAQKYLGYDQVGQTLYPLFLGGPLITKLQLLLTAFLMSSNHVNTIEKNWEKPNNESTLGSGGSMIPETSFDNGSTTTHPLQNNNLIPLDQPPTGVPPDVSQRETIRTDIVDLTSPILHSESVSLEALVNGLVTNEANVIARPDSMLRYRNAAVYAAVTRTPAPVTLPTPPQGKNNLLALGGSSMTNILTQVTHNVISPDSYFAQAKKLADRVKQNEGHIIPKDKVQFLKTIGTDPAYKGLLQNLATNAFGNDSRVPTILSGSLGKLGKGFANSVAPSVAIIASHYGLTSSEGSSPPAVLGKNKLIQAAVKALKLGIHVVGKLASTTGKDITKAANIAKVGSKDIKTGGKDLAAVLDL